MTEDEQEEEKRKKMRQVGVYVTIPFVLAVPPVIGWAIGRWLDHAFGTEPYLMFAFILFGIASGIREFYRLIKRFGNGT